MPLSPGEKLGPYELVSPIGAGGMDEIYKARDTRLDRTLALLNHPHFCALYGIGPGHTAASHRSIATTNATGASQPAIS